MEGIYRVSQFYEDPAEALTDSGLKFWRNGEEIPVTAVTEEMLNPEDLVVLDKDGTMHVIITADVEGTAAAVEDARQD